MPRFFVSKGNFNDGFFELGGDDAWHIARSLRMAVGEGITVCDGEGTEYECVLRAITDTSVMAFVESERASNTESPVRVTLYQALPKGDKMDLIVQKAVEEGAFSIVPFISERCVSRPDAKTIEKKTVRWQRIALEAAKQCGRGFIPTVEKAISYEQLLSRLEDTKLSLFCYEGEGTLPIKEILKKSNDINEAALIIGSEGGFSAEEFSAAMSVGATPTGLGKRILRCESASGYALACISYEFEL